MEIPKEIRSTLRFHRPYLLENGLYSVVKGHPDQNPIRWSCQNAEVFYESWRHPGVDSALKLEIRREIERLLKVFEACEIKPGLLARNPENTGGKQGWDDVVARLAFSTICKRLNLEDKFPERFLSYGLRHLGFYFTQGFSFKDLRSAYLGRYPHLFAQATLAASKVPYYLRRKWLIHFGLYDAVKKPFPTDQDGKVLMWFMVKTIQRSGVYCPDLFSACEFFTDAFRSEWEYGIGEVLSVYWKSNSPDHPNIPALLNDWGQRFSPKESWRSAIGY